MIFLLFFLFLLVQPALADQNWTRQAQQAIVLEKASKLAEAEALWLQLIEECTRKKLTVELSQSYFYLGRVYSRGRSWDQAERWLLRAREGGQDEPSWTALVDLQLGLNAIEQMQFSLAAKLLGQARLAAQQAQDLEIELRALSPLADVLASERRWSEAADLYSELASHQRKVNSEQLPMTLYLMALQQEYLGQLDTAEKNFREASVLFGSDPRAQRALSRLALMWFQAREFARAEKIYRELLSTPAGTPEDRQGLADCLAAQGRYQQALALYRQLLQQDSQSLVLQRKMIMTRYRLGDKAQALAQLETLYSESPLNHALFLDELGEPDRAIQLLETLLKVEPDTTTRWADAASQLAILRIRNGELAAAEALLRRALQRVPKPQELGSRANLTHNLAETFLQRYQPEQAIPLLEQSIAAWRQLKKVDSLILSLNNLAAAQQDLGRWDQALGTLREAEEAARGQQVTTAQGTVANSLAYLYHRLGRADDAQAYYKKALELRRHFYDRRGEAATLTSLGVALAEGGALISARHHWEQALKLCTELSLHSIQATLYHYLLRYFPEDPQSPFWARRLSEVNSQIVNPSPQARVAELIAQVRKLQQRKQWEQANALIKQVRTLGDESSLPEDYVEGLALHLEPGQPDIPDDVCATILEYLEHFIRRMPSRLSRSFVAKQHRVLRRVVTWSFRNQGAKGLFESEERIRALGVLALTQGQAVDESHLPEALRQRRNSVEARLHELLRRSSRSSNLEQLKREYRLVCEEVEGYSLAQGLVRKARPATLSSVQASLLPGELMVEFVDLEQHRVAVLIQSQGSPMVVDLGVISRLQRFSQDGDSTTRLATLEGLGRSLWRPWADKVGPDIERLILIPTGSLYHVPLAAISLDNQPLIARYQVECATSATSWMVSRRSPGRGQGALLAAQGQANPQLYALPGTLQEVARLKRVLPGALTMLEHSMTRDNLRHQAAQVRWLHLATHGNLDPQEPLLGGLACADGMLTVADIFRWRLQAEVVVLSACDSGRVNQQDGQEYVGLTQAFQCAGARSMLATLWSVSDQDTAVWMESLYRQLQDGKTLGQATQQATLSMRAQNADPYLWAPFVIWGDGAVRL